MGHLDVVPTAVAASLGPDPGAPAEVSAQQREVLAVLRTLPAGQQEVVRLKFQSDLSYREISDITGHSVTNVGNLLHTALATVRDRMREDGAVARAPERSLQ